MARYQMPVLNKDNETWREVIDKMTEEQYEAFCELHRFRVGSGTKERAAGELLDLAQVCFGALEKLVREERLDLQEAVRRHEAKLKARGWTLKAAHFEMVSDMEL